MDLQIFRRVTQWQQQQQQFSLTIHKHIYIYIYQIRQESSNPNLKTKFFFQKEKVLGLFIDFVHGKFSFLKLVV